MRTLLGIVLLAVGSVMADDIEPVQVLFPYTIVGRVVDAENKAFAADSGIVLIVRDSSGTVLARTSVYTPGTLSAWNFRLGVPVASKRTSGYAAKGDTLTLTAIKDNVTYAGMLKGDDARIGEAGASVSVRIMLSDDSNGNGIADTYEQSKYNWMRRYCPSLSGVFVNKTIDPIADYDGDGQNNYAEYLAGTDPFDAADRFGVDTFESEATYDESNYVKLTFETNPGRTYAIRESENLADAASTWKQGSFKENPSDATSLKRIVNSRSQWELRTVYLLKQGDRHFYKVELEQ